MSVVGDQAAAIRAAILTVPEVGVVLDYQPVPRGEDWASFRELFAFTPTGGPRQVRAWTIQYLSETRTAPTMALGAEKVRRDIRWIVRGQMSWAGTSERDWRDLLEAVARALDEARSLGGTALDHDPVDISLPNNGAGIVFGDVLCHYAEIVFAAQVEETLVTS